MDDLISEFITETTESLAVLDQELVKLEQNPNDHAILGNIFRLVHTIKGTCGFLGLPRLESVAHAGENVLGKIRDGEIIVTGDAISIVLEALDCIKALVEYLAENAKEAEGDDKDLIKRLNQFAETRGASGAGGTGAAPAQAAAPVENFIPDAQISSPFSQEVMDELERAFASASSTIEGGMDFTRAPTDFIAPSASETPAPAYSAPVAAASAAPAIRTPLSEQTKEKAIKQGLDTEAKEGGAVANQSIRVNLDVLESLMQMVSELVLTRNQLLQVVRHRDDRELKAPLQQLSQITSELQESVMKTRMQPIGNAWSKFPRLVRDLSHEVGKKIDLKMHGESTELDRQLLEMIKDPLTHMVRNSCDHGLETPSDRVAAGKPETGTVSLSAYHEGGHIIIKITDDGRGLNIERIKQKIIEKNLAEENELAQMSDEQIMQYIFKPGFSTAEKVTSVSGRGVGMDVVRTNIEKIGGTVSLSSAYGKGSTFHIKIPLTLAIVSVLLIEAGGQRFAVPQINVLELVRVGAHADYKVETINHSSVLRLRDKLLPLARLRDILEIDTSPVAESHGEENDCYVVVLRIGTADVGLIVDKIYDTEEIVVKPVNMVLGDIDVYSGNTILGDGSVIMILDPNGIAKHFGEADHAGASEKDMASKLAQGEKYGSFLIFDSGGGAPKAVPLELVSRLEVIEASSVEYAGQNAVVQYRGGLMRLKTLPGIALPTQDTFDVVVFTYDGRTVGLAVDAIVDIQDAPMAVQLAAWEEQYLGSTVIEGRTTDVVDVGYLLKDLGLDLEHIGNTATRVSGVRVLVVEDSPFFRKLIVPFLEAIGYDVTEAANPSQALDLVNKAARFDLIVTDIEMPEMDGFELVTELRRDPRYSAVPMIAFTSTVNEQFRERSHRAGMNNIILKTDREALLAAIEAELHATKEAA